MIKPLLRRYQHGIHDPENIICSEIVCWVDFFSVQSMFYNIPVQIQPLSNILNFHWLCYVLIIPLSWAGSLTQNICAVGYSQTLLENCDKSNYVLSLDWQNLKDLKDSVIIRNSHLNCQSFCSNSLPVHISVHQEATDTHENTSNESKHH